MSTKKIFTHTGKIVPSYCTTDSVSLNIDFILSHLEGPLFPRNIMTKRLGRQMEVYNKEAMLRYFEWSDYQDCRISAYPTLTQYNGLNLVAPSLVMIDLDLNNFESEIVLDRGLKSTLDRIYGLLKVKPTVLWTGNGYHIYLPVKAFVLEEEQVFASFSVSGEGPDLSTKFLRYAEQLFTNGKHDPQHRPSINSCLLRVPGTYNSKNRQQVRIIKEWENQRSVIQYMLRDFRCYLIQERLNDLMNAPKRLKSIASTEFNNTIGWIEQLLQTPIADHRKYCVWRILAPYLVNVRGLSDEAVLPVIMMWLDKCNAVRRLSFYPKSRVREQIQRARRIGYYPISFNNLQKENPSLYHDLRVDYGCRLE